MQFYLELAFSSKQPHFLYMEKIQFRNNPSLIQWYTELLDFCPRPLEQKIKLVLIRCIFDIIKLTQSAHSREKKHEEPGRRHSEINDFM